MGTRGGFDEICVVGDAREGVDSSRLQSTRSPLISNQLPTRSALLTHPSHRLDVIQGVLSLFHCIMHDA